jgi:hypothetical protein
MGVDGAAFGGEEDKSHYDLFLEPHAAFPPCRQTNGVSHAAAMRRVCSEPCGQPVIYLINKYHNDHIIHLFVDKFASIVGFTRKFIRWVTCLSMLLMLLES